MNSTPGPTWGRDSRERVDSWRVSIVTQYGRDGMRFFLSVFILVAEFRDQLLGINILKCSLLLIFFVVIRALFTTRWFKYSSMIEYGLVAT